MSYNIQQISAIIYGTASLADPSYVIEHLLTDSRRVIFPSSSLFFAITTKRRNGNEFIEELYDKGVRNFVVNNSTTIPRYKDANFVSVEDTLRALQGIATYHLDQFDIPVIGITGSNGKTVVKEWLNELLQNDYNIVRSPKSYNSQLGVPLSVWQVNNKHNLAIFEAGISQTQEMAYLQEVIKPTIGIFTNIGNAHSEGFENDEEKAAEKVKLFKTCKLIVYSRDGLRGVLPASKSRGAFFGADAKLFCWSRRSPADLVVVYEHAGDSSTIIKTILEPGKELITIEVPFTDQPSIDNALTCLALLLALGYTQKTIGDRFKLLTSVEMRMQLKKGVNNCIIINDSYSNDLSSLVLALDYLKNQKGLKRGVAIISDIAESGLDPVTQFNSVVALLRDRNIERAVLIGPEFYQCINTVSNSNSIENSTHIELYSTTKEFLNHLDIIPFKDEAILLKGARKFEFETIGLWLEQKTHQTVMEVNLDAIIYNLKQHQHYLKASTKIMAMVKAFSYGSGSSEVASLLQFHKVDYLAVAYVDEGIDLRKSGISMPVMVMSPELSTFSFLVEYNLEPELYSPVILKAFLKYLQDQGITHFPIHLKIDTGMHRLGFNTREIDKLISFIRDQKTIVIKSVFSHLAGSDDARMDQITRSQVKLFEEACTKIQEVLPYSFIRHLSNSAAIIRHRHLQYDMVRLGIGLYGVENSTNQLNLQNVMTLKTTIAQIQMVKAGGRVGYSATQSLSEDSLIATVRIGYADGYSRKFSNGVGKMLLNGYLAPVAGNVCMDLTMLNVTHAGKVQEGDEVEVFGPGLPVQQLAEWAGTIAYEILTGISERVKRVYYEA